MGTSDFSPYVGNKQFEGYGRVQTLQIGQSALHDVVVEKMNAPNSKFAGVLGYDFFAHAIVNVNVAKQQLQIEDPRTYKPQMPAGSFTFPVDLTSDVPAIALTLPSGAIAHPVLDSDLSGFMMLSQALYDSGKISGPQLTQEASFIFDGAGAAFDPVVSSSSRMAYTSWNATSTSGTCISVHSVSVGPYAYQEPPVCLGGTNVFGDDGGSIGLDFLRHFNWVIDYPHEQFTLAPNGQ
jgi:hypothetical protein